MLEKNEANMKRMNECILGVGKNDVKEEKFGEYKNF